MAKCLKNSAKNAFAKKLGIILKFLPKMTNAATAEQQKIVEGFQKLRQQQQEAAGEIGRVEADLRTHQYVLILL